MRFKTHTAFIALVFTPACMASVTEYGTSQRDRWFADVGGAANVSTVDFTGYTDFMPIADEWASLGVHFHGFVVTVGQSFTIFPNDGWGVRGEPDINITFDEPINWIAADFPGGTIIGLYLDDQLIYESSVFGSSGTGFFGRACFRCRFQPRALSRPDRND